MKEFLDQLRNNVPASAEETEPQRKNRVVRLHGQAAYRRASELASTADEMICHLEEEIIRNSRLLEA
jgi:hypothetical protein